MQISSLGPFPTHTLLPGELQWGRERKGEGKTSGGVEAGSPGSTAISPNTETALRREESSSEARTLRPGSSAPEQVRGWTPGLKQMQVFQRELWPGWTSGSQERRGLGARLWGPQGKRVESSAGLDFWVWGGTDAGSLEVEPTNWRKEVWGSLKLRCCLLSSEETGSSGLGVRAMDSGQSDPRLNRNSVLQVLGPGLCLRTKNVADLPALPHPESQPFFPEGSPAPNLQRESQKGGTG